MIGGLRILEVALPMIALTSPPDTAFTTAVGGPGEDWSFSVAETPRHELVVAGYTGSFGEGAQDGWLTVHDMNGDSLWSRTYGGNGSDQLLFVLPTDDGGLAMAGIDASHEGKSRDLWIQKTNADGDLRWTRSFGGPFRDTAHCLVKAADGGYLVVGRTESHKAGKDMDAWMLKVSEDGDSLWSRTFGGSGYDLFFHVLAQPDGYLMTGVTTTDAEGTYDGYMVKTNLQGDSLWGKTIGGVGHDRFRAAALAPDGGSYVCGSTESWGAGSLDFWLMRFDADGNELWQRTYGGRSQEMSFMITAVDSFLVMCGHTFSYGAGHADGWFLKVNAIGDSVWSKTFGGPDNDDIYGLIRTSDGGFAGCGYTQSFSGDRSMDYWLVKTTPDTAAIKYVKPGDLTIKQKHSQP